MTLFDLLKLSESGREYSFRLQSNLKYGCYYLWIDKVNQVLKALKTSSDIKIVIKKFKNLKNISQIFDKIAEILVAFEFLDKHPIFLPDDIGKPDIYLEETKEYIEVKRLNESDEEKKFWSSLNPRVIYLTDVSDKLNKQKEMKESLFKKARYHIDKAVSQMKNVNGIIYLVYTLDRRGWLKSLPQREEEFEKFCREYFISLNKNNLKFQIKEFNRLMAE